MFYVAVHRLARPLRRSAPTSLFADNLLTTCRRSLISRCCASYAAERKVYSPGFSFQGFQRKKALFPATSVEFGQTRLFLFSKAEAQVFPVIATTKIVIEFVLFGDQLINVGEIFVAQLAQAFRYGLGIANLRPNQPERVHERRTDEFVPLLAEVPEMKFTSMALPEAEGLIADK